MSVGGICFAADGFGGSAFLGGPSHSRIDALIALLSADVPVSVVATERIDLPAWTEPLALQRPDWHVVPRLSPLEPHLDRTLPARLCHWMRDVRLDSSFRRRLLALEPGVLWVEGHASHRMLAELRDWPARRRVMTLRGSPEQFTGRYRGEYELDRAVRELQVYDGIVAVSLRVGEMWRQLPGLEGKKLIYLPNCAREEEARLVRLKGRAAIRAELGWGPDQLVGVCPGTVQHRKGQDLIVEALRVLRSAYPGFRAVMVGGIHRGRGGEEVMAAAHGLGLGDRVDFAGHRPNALEYIHAADILLFPSREEAMPLAVLEAMALGTPIVASNVCGIPELVEDGTEALLFDHAEPARFAHQVERLLGDPGLRVRLATAAESKYDAVFARRHHMARYRAAVKELLS